MRDHWRLEVFLDAPKYLRSLGWRLSAHDKEAKGLPIEERIVHAKNIHDQYPSPRITFRLKNSRTKDIIPTDVL